jgi:hypothetical protein
MQGHPQIVARRPTCRRIYKIGDGTPKRVESAFENAPLPSTWLF